MEVRYSWRRKNKRIYTRLMQTTLVLAMLKSRMRHDVGQLSVELAGLRHIYVCSDV